MPQEDWDAFVEPQPWVVRPGADIVIRDSSSADRAASLEAEFPELHRLLDAGSALAVDIDDQPFELVTWATSSGSSLSWLCRTPNDEPPADVFSAHGRLLKCFGGIVDRSFNEPSTWLLNCNDALTEREARANHSLLEAYAWMMEDHGGSWPIDPANYYSICSEANGNTTLCNRYDGTILLFAPDHAFDHIVPLDGCPPYSLYRIPTAIDFTSWVEEIARQWLDAIA